MVRDEEEFIDHLSKCSYMDNTMNVLYTELNKMVSIPSEEWDFFTQIISQRNISKHNHFVKAGEAPESVAFCVKGLFRLYYTTPDGNEFNKNFCSKGDFVTSYSALLQNSPSHLSIQALSDSLLIIFPFREFQALYTRHACWERLGRIIAENLFLHKEMREQELLMLSAEDRYRLFMKRLGPMSKQIPQYHIASYLGITPVALSRIRKRLT